MGKDIPSKSISFIPAYCISCGKEGEGPICNDKQCQDNKHYYGVCNKCDIGWTQVIRAGGKVGVPLCGGCFVEFNSSQN